MTLDKYIKQTEYPCKYCSRIFNSEKGLNIHITKSHTQAGEPRLYHGEGLRKVESNGTFVDLQIRIKADLWRSLKRFALLNGISPEEVIVASLINLKLPEKEKPCYFA